MPKKSIIKCETGPFYDAYIRDPKKVVKAIYDGIIPIGAMQLNLAFIRRWSNEKLKNTELTEIELKDIGLEVKKRKADSKNV